MFVEWSHSTWHQPGTNGMFPLPIERHAAPPEPNLRHAPLHLRLGIANALRTSSPDRTLNRYPSAMLVVSGQAALTATRPEDAFRCYLGGAGAVVSRLYSTVTLLARLRGLSTSCPSSTARW